MNFDKKKIMDISILAGYVGLIYSTLTITPKLYDGLKDILGPSFEITMNAFIAGIALLLFAFFYRPTKRKSIMAHLGAMAVVSIFTLLLVYLTPSISEKEHLLEYAFLGYLALRVFRNAPSRDLTYLYVALTILIVGYLDEFIQKFLPNRAYELRDVVINILSGFLGLVLIMFR